MTDSKFVFYSKSADKKAGKGTNEILNVKDKFYELEKIKDWRKVLSNFYICNFIHDKNIFKSAEHAYHYRKYLSIGKKNIAELLISGNKYGDVEPSEAKSLSGKGKKSLLVLNKQQQQKWVNESKQAKYQILKDKFTACDLAKKVLVLTYPAQLWHQISRSQPERWEDLEQIRDEIINSEKHEELSKIHKEQQKQKEKQSSKQKDKQLSKQKQKDKQLSKQKYKQLSKQKDKDKQQSKQKDKDKQLSKQKQKDKQLSKQKQKENQSSKQKENQSSKQKQKENQSSKQKEKEKQSSKQKENQSSKQKEKENTCCCIISSKKSENYGDKCNNNRKIISNNKICFCGIHKNCSNKSQDLTCQGC